MEFMLNDPILSLNDHKVDVSEEYKVLLVCFAESGDMGEGNLASKLVRYRVRSARY